MKFRVLRGSHSEGSYPKGHAWAGKPVVYERGEVVDSATNLAKFNAQGTMGPKFQRIYDGTQATDKVQQGKRQADREEAIRNADDGNMPGAPIQPQLPSDGLDEMSLQDLRKLAKEEGVTLPPNSTKEEAVTAIREVPITA